MDKQPNQDNMVSSIIGSLHHRATAHSKLSRLFSETVDEKQMLVHKLVEDCLLHGTEITLQYPIPKWLDLNPQFTTETITMMNNDARHIAQFAFVRIERHTDEELTIRFNLVKN